MAVFTIPDQNGRPDPLAEKAEKDGVPVFKFPRWRSKGKALPAVSTVCVCVRVGVCVCVCVCVGVCAPLITCLFTSVKFSVPLRPT